MKKLITLLLVLLIFSSFVLICPAALFVSFDVNSDGRTDASDARFILRCAVGLEAYTVEQLYAGDTDSDGELTASDARNVLRCSVGMPVESTKENYALDSLIVKVKSEYIIDNSFEIALLATENVKDCELLFKDSDGGWFFTVYLKWPGKKNLYRLKEYYKGIDAVELVEFNWISHINLA